MKRLLSFILAAALLAAGTASAADRPAGTWRMTLDLLGGQTLTFLLTLENQNGQWTGQCLGATGPLGEKNAVENVLVNGDRLRFTITIDGQGLNFDGRVVNQGPIRGSIVFGTNFRLTSLEPSALTKFDRFELLKEVAAGTDAAPLLFETVAELLRQATASKAKPDEVRAWTDKLTKAAEPYGVRFQQAVAMRIVESLAGQADHVSVALTQAQRAERLLEPADELAVQMPILETLARLLTQANKAEEAKEAQARVTKLEERDYQDYLKKFPFKPDAYAGRKGKSDRAVLLELFTGAECEPCIPADLGFDALTMAYKPSEVVLLQYHVHVPKPDPLTNPSTEARMRYYGSQFRGTPLSLFNGKEEAGGGGKYEDTHIKYAQYKKVVDSILESPPRAKLQMTVRRDGEKIAVNAKVSDVLRPTDKMRLRIALAEEVVRYQGSNGIRYHHHVVRSFLGGPDGFPVKATGASEHQAAAAVDEVRVALNAYLDKFQQEREGTFPIRPLAFNKLMVVAFVQDDTNQEVMQVVQAEVK
jgi:hypothetical protein